MTLLDSASFNIEHDDGNKVNEGKMVPCRLCEEALGNLNFTSRYCSDCRKAFCVFHGNFSMRTGKCVICGSAKVRELNQIIDSLRDELAGDDL